VGVIQLPTLGMNATRLEFYFKKAKERGAKLLLLGEYVTNHFFKELVLMPKSMIKEQTIKHIKILKRLSKEHNITIVAPIIEVKGDNFYKKAVKISPKSVSYYMQQILIDYDHWDEESFFSNPITELKEPLTFNLDGFKIAVIFGFEIHFDPIWEFISKKKVDLVLMPTATTFGSKYRWRDIITTRAFLNNCYILRANRVGEYVDSEIKWHFYGDSMLVNPDGEIEMNLEDKESMLIEPISKDEVKECRRDWGFYNHLKKRGHR